MAAASPTVNPAAHDEGSVHRGFHAAHHSTILIMLPLILLAVLALGLLVILVICCAKSTGQSVEDADADRISKHSRKMIGRFAPYGYSDKYAFASPDVNNCITRRSLGFSSQTKCKGAQVFTYKELESATSGFSEQNVIGRGGSGVVYRGSLSDGTVSAIKMLTRDRKLGEREFRVEVDLLSRLQSSFLVGLLGYCADQHHRLLVFEYMPRRSLRSHLHSSYHYHHQDHLDWGTRLRIALDCAQALEFLHEFSVPTVIHRNLDSSNILLDQNFRAKLSGFGMAKMGSDKVDGHVLSHAFGSTGYVAPEYTSTGKLTTKSDVYSYGVVLLELLTGRVAVDANKPPGEQILALWALPMLTNRQKVVEMVDPTLHGRYLEKELLQIAAIAAVCLQPEADYRPLMTDVTQSLIPLVRSPMIFVPTPSRFQHQRDVAERSQSTRSLLNPKSSLDIYNMY